MSAFGFFSVGSLKVHSVALPTSALAIATAVVLVAFVLIILRADVVSQAIGFFSLENGVSVASLVAVSYTHLDVYKRQVLLKCHADVASRHLEVGLAQ